MRKTARDLYWGAKLVTSFSDAQLTAVIAAAGLSDLDAEHLERALRIRRDIIGRRYLRAMTAVENPVIAPDGPVCFDDLAITRGYAAAAEVRYTIEISDGHGAQLATSERAAAGPRTCVSLAGQAPGSGYRVVQIRARLGRAGEESSAKASRIHLRWRPAELRFAVVGLERDD
jgi:hypothetical protein